MKLKKHIRRHSNNTHQSEEAETLEKKWIIKYFINWLQLN